MTIPPIGTWAQPEYWSSSLARSRHAAALAAEARRENKRRKGMAALVASANGPGRASRGLRRCRPELRPRWPPRPRQSQRAIEIREGGLPLDLGNQGDLVAHIQKRAGRRR